MELAWPAQDGTFRIWAETHMPEIDRNNHLADEPPTL